VKKESLVHHVLLERGLIAEASSPRVSVGHVKLESGALRLAPCRSRLALRALLAAGAIKQESDHYMVAQHALLEGGMMLPGLRVPNHVQLASQGSGVPRWEHRLPMFVQTALLGLGANKKPRQMSRGAPNVPAESGAALWEPIVRTCALTARVENSAQRLEREAKTHARTV